MMQLSRRQGTGLAIALVSLILLTLFLAPSSGNIRQRGSTYSRGPDGYGAWYAFMQERGTPVQRWQTPFFAAPPAKPANSTSTSAKAKSSNPQPPAGLKTPATLLQIGNGIDPLDANEAWVKQGNVLILLGIKPRATKAPFTSDIEHPQGKIRIETSRRSPLSQESKFKPLLQDPFGAVVWQETLDKGRIIYAATPYLAANAYQDFRANYEFLAKLVTEPGHPVWVDEYLHGHKDPPPIVNKGTHNGKRGNGDSELDLLGYLSQTPLALVAIQAAVLFAVLIWGQNRRLGPPLPIVTPVIDNSEAYIQAMAGVLNKAGCSQFVLEMISKTEQLEVQKALGLGTIPLPLDTLVAAWHQQTQRPAEELQAMLRPRDRQRPMSEVELQQWVDQVRTIRQHLPGR